MTWKASMTYKSPGELAHLGPFVRARWSTPPERLAELHAAGREVPEAVAGLLAIDTGAQMSGIRLLIAEELGLRELEPIQMLGWGEQHAARRFEAVLSLALFDTEGALNFVRRAGPVVNLPGSWLDPRSRATNASRFPHRMIGVLGRDALAHFTLTYKGRGEIELVFDESSPHPAEG